MDESESLVVVSGAERVQLTKQAIGVYSGTAEMQNGIKLNVSSKMEGGKLSVEWKP